LALLHLKILATVGKIMVREFRVIFDKDKADVIDKNDRVILTTYRKGELLLHSERDILSGNGDLEIVLNDLPQSYSKVKVFFKME